VSRPIDKIYIIPTPSDASQPTTTASTTAASSTIGGGGASPRDAIPSNANQSSSGGGGQLSNSGNAFSLLSLSQSSSTNPSGMRLSLSDRLMQEFTTSSSTTQTIFPTVAVFPEGDENKEVGVKEEKTKKSVEAKLSASSKSSSK
jgi:hypothetical protein